MGEPGRPEELIDRHLKLQTATGNIATALGTLALLWSTVVLLGGFVTALRIKEFWLLTALSFLMAFKMVDTAVNEIRRKGIYMEEGAIVDIVRRQKWIKAPCFVFVLRVVLVIKWIFAGFFVYLLAYSPFVCVGISIWRLVRRDYADAGGDTANSAKLNGASDIFYALILLQSLFAAYFILLIFAEDVLKLERTTCKHYGFVKEWGSRFVRKYYLETEKKINKDGALPDNWNLVTYCVELLQSASGDDDQLWGARALDQLFDANAEDIIYARQKLLTSSSRLSLHNLIAMLGGNTTGNNNIEIMERAARIVAHLASDLHITQFPGTLVQSICSLLESCKQCYPEPQLVTCPSSSSENNDPDNEQTLTDPDKKQDPPETVVVLPIQDQETDHEHERVATFSGWIKKHREAWKQRNKAPKKRRFPYECRGAKELVSQGLLILEGLTRDEGNCAEISKDQRLLAKVTSPLSSHDFLSYARDDTMAAMLSKSLTVVSRLLVSSAGDATTRLRQKLATDMEAVRNLMCVLETDSKGARQMHEQALEILTELAFGGYLKQQDFVKLFNALQNKAIAPEPNNADREKATRLRGKTGEALSRLLPIGIAAGILPKQNAISLLTKVLDQIISSKMGRTAYAATEEAEADSEQPATQGNEMQSEERNFMSGMLLVAMVIIRNENVISKEYFARAIPGEDAALVKKLKEILEANKHSTAECLMIVKLTCQVVIAMIQVNPSCIKHFNEHGFKEELTGVLGIMLEADDCMLFAGNVREVMIKPVRSLASLVKEAQELMT